MEKFAYFQESMADEIVDIGGDTTEQGQSLADLSSGNHSEFTVMSDEDDVMDFCMETDLPQEDAVITVMRFDTSTYAMEAQSIIGGRPPRRPH